ncbi:hypothetical protein Q4567_04600 [Aliiglaciecola sp. 2_MG-2023]|nr:hypothetical protein [Aliiglaciecola sp. 2_MG-2023]
MNSISTEQAINILLKAAELAPSADNSQPLVKKVLNNRFTIYEKQKETVGFSDQQGFLSSFALGLATQSIVLQAEYMGVAITVKASLMESAGRLNVEFVLPGPKIDVSNTDISPDISSRYTERALAFSKPTGNIDIQQMQTYINEFDCQLSKYDKAVSPTFKQIAKLAGRAEEMRFQDKNIHAEMTSSIDFDDKYQGKKHLPLKVLKLDFAALLGLKLIRSWKLLSFLNNFCFYKMLGFKGATEPLSKAPLIFCLSSRSYNKHDLFNAGRALMSVWTKLTAQGLAVHPYAAVGTMMSNHFTFQDAKLEKKRQAFSVKCKELIGSDTPCILLRVGIFKGEKVKTGRMPIENA